MIAPYNGAKAKNGDFVQQKTIKNGQRILNLVPNLEHEIYQLALGTPPNIMVWSLAGWHLLRFGIFL